MSTQNSMMKHLMKDLMDLASSESGTFKLNETIFDLDKQIEKAFNVVKYQAKTKNLRLYSASRDKKFYPLFKCIKGDKRRYNQIIVNFVSNAIKFSHQNSKVKVKLEIKQLSLKRDPDRPTVTNEYYVTFKLTIRDYGYGMSKEQLKKLFINFSKIEENAHANRNGVGLGLSICKSLIEQMGGSIKVKSRVDKGSAFIITINTDCPIEDVRELGIEHLIVHKIEGSESTPPNSSSLGFSSSSVSSEKAYFNQFNNSSQLKPLEKPTCLVANDSCFLLLGLKAKLSVHFSVDTADNGY